MTVNSKVQKRVHCSFWYYPQHFVYSPFLFNLHISFYCSMLTALWLHCEKYKASDGDYITSGKWLNHVRQQQRGSLLRSGTHSKSLVACEERQNVIVSITDTHITLCYNLCLTHTESHYCCVFHMVRALLRLTTIQFAFRVCIEKTVCVQVLRNHA